jgi:hypothetical protein
LIALLAAAKIWSSVFSKPAAPLVHRVKDRERDGLEIRLIEVFELGEFLVGEDGALELDEVAAFRDWLEQVALAADRGLARGDEFLADAIDRRVGDLREELL